MSLEQAEKLLLQRTNKFSETIEKLTADLEASRQRIKKITPPRISEVPSAVPSAISSVVEREKIIKEYLLEVRGVPGVPAVVLPFEPAVERVHLDESTEFTLAPRASKQLFKGGKLKGAVYFALVRCNSINLGADLLIDGEKIAFTRMSDLNTQELDIPLNYYWYIARYDVPNLVFTAVFMTGLPIPFNSKYDIRVHNRGDAEITVNEVRSIVKIIEPSK